MQTAMTNICDVRVRPKTHTDKNLLTFYYWLTKNVSCQWCDIRMLVFARMCLDIKTVFVMAWNLFECNRKQKNTTYSYQWNDIHCFSVVPMNESRNVSIFMIILLYGYKQSSLNIVHRNHSKGLIASEMFDISYM